MQECIRFLEHSVHHLESGDEALHNLLVALYVSHKPDDIIPYLTSGILNIYLLCIKDLSCGLELELNSLQPREYLAAGLDHGRPPGFALLLQLKMFTGKVTVIWLCL